MDRIPSFSWFSNFVFMMFSLRSSVFIAFLWWRVRKTFLSPCFSADGTVVSQPTRSSSAASRPRARDMEPLYLFYVDRSFLFTKANSRALVFALSLLFLGYCGSLLLVRVDDGVVYGATKFVCSSRNILMDDDADEEQVQVGNWSRPRLHVKVCSCLSVWEAHKSRIRKWSVFWLWNIDKKSVICQICVFPPIFSLIVLCCKKFCSVNASRCTGVEIPTNTVKPQYNVPQFNVFSRYNVEKIYALPIDAHLFHPQYNVYFNVTLKNVGPQRKVISRFHC